MSDQIIGFLLLASCFVLGCIGLAIQLRRKTGLRRDATTQLPGSGTTPHTSPSHWYNAMKEWIFKTVSAGGKIPLVPFGFSVFYLAVFAIFLIMFPISGRAWFSDQRFFFGALAATFVSGCLWHQKSKLAKLGAVAVLLLPLIYLSQPSSSSPSIVSRATEWARSEEEVLSLLPIMAVDRTPRGGEAWQLTLPTTTWTRILRGQDLELCFEPFRGGAARIRASNGQVVTLSPGQAAVLPAGHWIDVMSVDPTNPSVFKYWWVIGSCRPSRNI